MSKCPAIIHIDRGGEFGSKTFLSSLEKLGIRVEVGPGNSPETNGLAERFNQPRNAHRSPFSSIARLTKSITQAFTDTKPSVDEKDKRKNVLTVPSTFSAIQPSNSSTRPADPPTI